MPSDANLVFIGNPTNPTSVAHSRTTLLGLIKPGRIVVIDEAFADCLPGERESVAGDGDLTGLVVIRSLTKTWGLAGLRVGYLLAAPDIIRLLAAAQPAVVGLRARPRGLRGHRFTRRAAGGRTVGGPPRGRPCAPAAQHGGRCAASRRRHQGHHSGARRRGIVRARRHGDRRGIRTRLLRRGFAVRRGETFPGLGPGWIRVAVRDIATSEAFAAALADARCED